MCILFKLHYAKFGVSNLFFPNVIEEKPLGGRLEPPPLAKERLKGVSGDIVCTDVSALWALVVISPVNVGKKWLNPELIAKEFFQLILMRNNTSNNISKVYFGCQGGHLPEMCIKTDSFNFAGGGVQTPQFQLSFSALSEGKFHTGSTKDFYYSLLEQSPCFIPFRPLRSLPPPPPCQRWSSKPHKKVFCSYLR